MILGSHLEKMIESAEKLNLQPSGSGTASQTQIKTSLLFGALATTTSLTAIAGKYTSPRWSHQLR